MYVLVINSTETLRDQISFVHPPECLYIECFSVTFSSPWQVKLMCAEVVQGGSCA